MVLGMFSYMGADIIMVPGMSIDMGADMWSQGCSVILGLMYGPRDVQIRADICMTRGCPVLWGLIYGQGISNIMGNDMKISTE